MLLKMIIMFLVLFIFSSHPMVVISGLMGLVIFYSMMIYMNMSSFWFGYMLMMIMLSGVLVLFTYMVSLLPNESFGYLSFFFIMFMIILFSTISVLNLSWVEDISSFSYMMWGGYISEFNIFLISFLLNIMIMVVWVSDKSMGAIRAF